MLWETVLRSISKWGFRDAAQVNNKTQNEDQGREEEHDLEFCAQHSSQFQMGPVDGTQKVAQGTSKTWKARKSCVSIVSKPPSLSIVPGPFPSVDSRGNTVSG